MSKLSIIIPCYFNEGSIAELGVELLAEEANYPPNTQVEYVFVDDHSGDGTLAELKKLKVQMPGRITIIELTANLGSYKAMVAALESTTGNYIAIMAADQQDPPAILPQLFAQCLGGNKLAIAYREKLEGTWSAKLFTRTFHFIMGLFTSTQTPVNGFDVVLFDRSLLDNIKGNTLAEVNLFYYLLSREKRPYKLPYTKRKRPHGNSMWTLSKKMKHLFKSLFYFFPIPLYRLLGK